MDVKALLEAGGVVEAPGYVRWKRRREDIMVDQPTLMLLSTSELLFSQVDKVEAKVNILRERGIPVLGEEEEVIDSGDIPMAVLEDFAEHLSRLNQLFVDTPHGPVDYIDIPSQDRPYFMAFLEAVKTFPEKPIGRMNNEYFMKQAQKAAISLRKYRKYLDSLHTSPS